MMTESNDSQKPYEKLDEEFLHSAAIIDANGHEIAITKEMIDAACEQLSMQIDQFKHDNDTK